MGADHVCGGIVGSPLPAHMTITNHLTHEPSTDSQNDTLKSQTGHPKTTQQECNTSKMSTSAMLWGAYHTTTTIQR